MFSIFKKKDQEARDNIWREVLSSKTVDDLICCTNRQDKCTLGIMSMDNIDFLALSGVLDKTCMMRNAFLDMDLVIHAIRMSTDGLIFVLSPTNEEEIRKAMDTVVETMRVFNSEDFYCKISIGISIASKKEGMYKGLKEAYMALQHCKGRADVDYALYSEVKDQIDRKQYEKKMEIACICNSIIQEESIQLYYQPIVNSKDYSTAYHEVLLRIKDSRGSNISTATLVSVAEEYGMVISLDRVMLQKSIAVLQENENVILSVNVSNASIEDGEWLKLFKSLLAKDQNIIPRLIVEITETAKCEVLESLQSFVEELRNLGVKVAIDDFGSGYTSLQQLRSIKVDIVKIDGSLVKGITESERNRAFLHHVMDLAHVMGAVVVAECVEDIQTRDFLKEDGADYMQGFLFGKPAVTLNT